MGINHNVITLVCESVKKWSISENLEKNHGFVSHNMLYIYILCVGTRYQVYEYMSCKVTKDLFENFKSCPTQQQEYVLRVIQKPRKTTKSVGFSVVDASWFPKRTLYILTDSRIDFGRMNRFPEAHTNQLIPELLSTTALPRSHHGGGEVGWRVS